MDIDLNSLLATENILMFAISICVAVAITLSVYVGYRVYTQKQEDEELESDLKDIFTSEFGEDEDLTEDNGFNLSKMWYDHWRNKARRAGIRRYRDLPSNIPGRDVILFTVVGAVLIAALSINPFLGILGGAVIPFVYNAFLGFRINQVEASLNSQVPPFLAAFKANIQANETPDRALIRVIDDMGDPLYTEMLPIKKQIQSGTEISTTLDNLKERTTSVDLRFLASCIKIAIEYGADLEKQIDVIQGVIVERQKVSNQLASASRQAKPAMIVGSLMIPVMFLAIYFMDERAQEFWFINPISYLALLAIAFLYGIGMFFTKKMVDNIKKL